MRAGSCCGGHCHAYIETKKGVRVSACPGGGTRWQAARGNRPEHRVDRADQDGWRGVALEGAPANPLPYLGMPIAWPRHMMLRKANVMLCNGWTALAGAA